MTPNEFRKLALSLSETAEGAHMAHPDFRVDGKVFASLGAPSEDWGMIKLPPEQQAAFVKLDEETFVPANGAWGRAGCTLIRLAAAKKSIVREALALAHEAAVAAKPTKKQTRSRAAASATQENANPPRKRIKN